MVRDVALRTRYEIGRGVAGYMAAAVIAASQPDGFAFNLNYILRIGSVNRAAAVATDYKCTVGDHLGINNSSSSKIRSALICFIGREVKVLRVCQ